MPADHRWKFKPTYLLVCAALMAATAAHSTEVAPCCYTWGFGSNAYKANSLAAARNAGVTAVTLAFGVSGGGCKLGGGLEIIMNDTGTKSDVQQFIALRRQGDPVLRQARMASTWKAPAPRQACSTW